MRTHADRNSRRRAECQHGVFNRRQAIGDGHNKRTIHHRLERGIWKRVLPGVYAISGCPETWFMKQMAACLWARDGIAAGRAAGYLYGLPECTPPPIELMTSTAVAMPHSGITVHETTWLPVEQIGMVNRIPATSVERTLMSLSAQLSPTRAAIAFDQAITKGLTTLAGIDRHLWLTARKGRDGCRLLRDLKNERWEIGMTPTTPLETMVFEMVVQQDLPRPLLQVELNDGHGRFVARPDFVYPDQKVILEAHSRQWHEGFAARRKDEERFERLHALGYRTIFVTWADVVRNARATGELIRRLLSDPGFALPWRAAEWN